MHFHERWIIKTAPNNMQRTAMKNGEGTIFFPSGGFAEPAPKSDTNP